MSNEQPHKRIVIRPDSDQGPTTEGAAIPTSIVIGPSCVTCSDEAVPCRVLSVDQETGMVLVVIGDSTTEVDISLVERVAPGDLLLVHGGVALERLEEPSDG